jgi:hypothetical protein
VAPGKRAAKSGGCPGANRSRRAEKIADVSRPGSQAGGATTSPSELKSLTQNSALAQNANLDGPAMRPLTPLAVENSVGKPAAPPKAGRPMSATGKRAWRTPIPDLAPVRSQGRAGASSFPTIAGPGPPCSDLTAAQTPPRRAWHDRSSPHPKQEAGTKAISPVHI